MNLSVSNIAWSSEDDDAIYAFLAEQGYTGLEIAPTRIFPDRPYDHLSEAKRFSDQLQNSYGLRIVSMQSIWYGIHENIFGSESERAFLVSYTKKAIDFAHTIGCKNIVFGCPKNRVLLSNNQFYLAEEFFLSIGQYAADHNTIIALEPNPPIYNTNFINTTNEAFDFCNQLACDGLKVNVDLGTCIYYGESIEIIQRNLPLVSHIHLSEPGLKPLQQRNLYRQLKSLDYDKYFSIEMASPHNLDMVKQTIRYVKDVMN